MTLARKGEKWAAKVAAAKEESERTGGGDGDDTAGVGDRAGSPDVGDLEKWMSKVEGQPDKKRVDPVGSVGRSV